MKILVTSGGTKVPIDRVRDITNMSHGTFGSRIAEAALRGECEVIYLISKDGKSPFSMTIDFASAAKLGDERAIVQAMLEEITEVHNLYEFVIRHRSQYTEIRFRNFDDYSAALQKILAEEKPDVTILAAAASDYGVANYTKGKIRSGSAMNIELMPYPKLIRSVKEWCPSTFLVGFKLLVGSTEDELIEAASKSIIENKCDLVVANDYESLVSGAHELMLLDRHGCVLPENEWSDGSHIWQGSGTQLATMLMRTVTNRIEVAKISENLQ